MQEFYFKDKKNGTAFMGICPNNDVNCLPFDYFRYGHALLVVRQFGDVLKIKSPIPFSEKMVNHFILEKTDKMINDLMSKAPCNANLQKLLLDDKLSYKEQKKLLRNQVLTPTDLLWLNKDAQEQGYLLDVYHEEKYPEKFNLKKHPACYYKQEDNSIETFGPSDMTGGEMRALLEQRKVVQARVYHKGEHWHCFYFTSKGLLGLESGLLGSKPHYHYLSDKSGITHEDLKRRIKECDMPSSGAHIIIDRFH